MDQYFASKLTTTCVYAFDSATGELSYAVMRLPPCPDSLSVGHVYAPISLNPDLRTPGLGEGSSEIVEEIPTPGDQAVHFVAKLQTRAPPGQGFVDAQDHHIWRAKRQVMEVERLVWQLEAALAEDGDFDYEGDVDEFDYEDKILSFEDDDCEFDCGVKVEDIGAITDYPGASVDEDSECALGSDITESLSSDSSEDSVTFDPPSSSVSAAEEVVPSTTSAMHLSTPSQITLPLGSALHSATGDSSAVAGDTSLSSLLQLDSSCGDASLFLDPLAGGAGPGCPPTEEDLFCPACYRSPIRLVWGDEPSDESLSDLVDDLLGEDELPYEPCTPRTAQSQVDVNIPTHPPIVAADWSLSQALASLGCEAIPGASTSSSASSLFLERRPMEARIGCNSESEDEPLAETVKKRRETPKTPKRRRKTIKRRRETGSAGKGKHAATPEVPRARRAPASDELAEAPLSTLRARVEQRKKQRRTMADSQSPRLFTGSSTTVQQAPPSSKRKRRRDDEKEEGEITEYESESQESDPDVPLAHVLASRDRSQSTLAHGAPPAKRVRFTSAVDSPRRLSRDGGRSRRSWAHRRWEERLMQRHTWAGQEGRRGMQVMSTDEDQLRRGVRTAKAVH